MYTLRIKKAKLQQAKYGYDILVSMVEMRKDWKHVKFVKLTQELVDKMVNKDIMVESIDETQNDTSIEQPLFS